MKKIVSPRFAAALFAVTLSAGSAALAGEVTLQDRSLAVSFDADSGALTRLENESSHWVMERRPELGVSFRLNAPSADHRDNFVLGRKQHAVKVEKTSDHELRLQWKDLASERGGVLPVTLTARVSLTNGTLTFAASVQNDSTQMISTVDFPCLGDLTAPAGAPPMQSRHMFYGNLTSQDISRGATVMSKQSLFCLIQSTNEGLYVEMHDPTQPYLLNFVFEPRPGSKAADNPARMEFRASHFVYVHPHTTAALAPVVLRGYRGDWHAGVDCYKEWRATWFKQPHLPAWARDVHSWTMLRMNTPEEDYTIPYTNFVNYGEEYASNGVQAVQLVGWNKGGQDRDDPSQDTDPKLGTWQEFHDAIAQVQAEGRQSHFVRKLNWADQTTAWYTNELYKYQAAPIPSAFPTNKADIAM